jgi:type IV pilus biogenesis protein PilP
MRTSKLLVLLSILLSGAVYADPQGYTIGAMDESNGATAYYNARAAEGVAREKAEKVRGGLPALRQIIVVETPGAGEQTVAVFYSNGDNRFEVQEGDPLPGGYTVKKIESARNRVQLEKGKRTIWVGFMRGGEDSE